MAERNQSRRAEILEELTERFRQHEMLTRQDVVSEYYSPQNEYEEYLANKQVKDIFNSIRSSFKSENIPFGNVDDVGHYCIPHERSHFEKMGIRRYKMVKGLIRGQEITMNEGVRQGMLQASSRTEAILVPAVMNRKTK